MNQDHENFVARRVRRAGEAYPTSEPDLRRLGRAIRARRHSRRVLRATGGIASVVALAVALVVIVPLWSQPARTNVTTSPRVARPVEPYLLFRPVDCSIPAFSRRAAGVSASTKSRPASACHSRMAKAFPTTPPAQDRPGATVILDSAPYSGLGNSRFVLGPADLTGSSVRTANLQKGSDGLSVEVTLTPSGLVAFNKVAAVRYHHHKVGAVASSTSEEAFDLNGVLIAVPTIEAKAFDGPISVTGRIDAAQAKNALNEIRAIATRSAKPTSR